MYHNWMCSYNDTTAASAVAAFMLVRGEHWFFAIRAHKYGFFSVSLGPRTILWYAQHYGQIWSHTHTGFSLPPAHTRTHKCTHTRNY